MFPKCLLCLSRIIVVPDIDVFILCRGRHAYFRPRRGCAIRGQLTMMILFIGADRSHAFEGHWRHANIKEQPNWLNKDDGRKRCLPFTLGVWESHHGSVSVFNIFRNRITMPSAIPVYREYQEGCRHKQPGRLYRYVDELTCTVHLRSIRLGRGGKHVC